jgi:hypothetical protein
LELQTKVALNEAEGLGFYEGEQPGGPKYRDYFYHSKTDSNPFDASGEVPTGLPAPIPIAPAATKNIVPRDRAESDASPYERIFNTR